VPDKPSPKFPSLDIIDFAQVGSGNNGRRLQSG
jgi:hypothetical protein